MLTLDLAERYVRAMLRRARTYQGLTALPIVPPLCQQLGQANPVAMVRTLVMSSFSDSPYDRRFLDILSQCDLDATATQQGVASQLGVSRRQYYRMRSYAIRAVAHRVHTLLRELPLEKASPSDNERVTPPHSPAEPAYFVFGSFAFDAHRSRLSCYGVEVPLKPKTASVLHYFLQHPHRMITKSELLDELWINEDVTEANLTQHVFLLRQAFSRCSPRETFIVTSARKGYRFVAPISIGAPPSDLGSPAWRAYVEGRYFADQRTAGSLQKAIEAYKRAIDLDPQQAAPHAGLSVAHVLAADYLFTEPRRAYALARVEAQQAVALEPDTILALLAMSDVRLFHDWDFEAAFVPLERAVWLEPNNALVRVYRAWYFAFLGRHESGVAEVETIFAREPFSLMAMTTLAAISVIDGRYDVAIDTAEAVLSLDPSYELVKYYYGAALAYSGRYSDALKHYDALKERSYDQQWLAIAAYAAARSGKKDRAKILIDELENNPGCPHIAAFNRAIAWIGMGELQKARQILAEGIALRDSWSVFIPSHAVFDAVPGIEDLRALIVPASTNTGD